MIFSHIMKIFHLKRGFDQIRRSRENVDAKHLWTTSGNYRHAILNEVKYMWMIRMSAKFFA